MAASPTPLLQVQDVVKVFDLPHRGFFGAARSLRAVAGVSLDIHAEETLGLVGESGCGKTTLGRIIVRLETATEGRVLFRGRDIHARSRTANHEDRRSIQMVFQDATGSLNPRRRVRDIVGLPVKAGGVVGPRKVNDYVSQVLEEVGLPSALGSRYPGQLSGGQQQRVALARAIALEPAVLVADEPLSALDVSVQAQILRLLERIRERRHLAMLFVSHDLAVVRYLCDRVAVMYLGRIVESGPVGEGVRASAPPVHGRAALRCSQHPAADGRPHRACRRSAQRGGHPARMPLPSTLLEGAGQMPHRGPSARPA